MEENKNKDSNQSTQYIKSGNMGNTIDNKKTGPKGAEQMDEHYSDIPAENNGLGNSFRNTNNSDNSDYGDRS